MISAKKTSILLFGSKNKTTSYESINIITVLGKCDKRYEGLMKLYADLSESAHPNFEGLCAGYSTAGRENVAVIFSNRWNKVCGGEHLNLMLLCMKIFEYEYNEVWPSLFEELEKWIAENDAVLEAAKGVDE